MSKRPGCGKRYFKTRLDALIALADCERRGRTEGRAYRCPRCGQWHLTSELLRRKARAL